MVIATPMQEIIADERTNKVGGVLLHDGTCVKADAVVCNADAPWAYHNLLPSSSYAKRMDNMEYTASTISFYWYRPPYPIVFSVFLRLPTLSPSCLFFHRGLDCVVPQLSAHNIFLNGDFKRSFDDIFQAGSLPRHPSFYIHVPSRIDSSASPDPTKDAVTVLVPISCIRADRAQDWDQLTDYARKYVFNVFQTKFGFDLRGHIITERINNPLTWRDKFNLRHGAALGLSHNVTQIGWMRPSITHDKYTNMFFVGAYAATSRKSATTSSSRRAGASVHPGTGVPIVLHGAGLVEKEVHGYMTGKTRKPSLLSSWVMLLYLLAAVLFILYVLF